MVHYLDSQKHIEHPRQADRTAMKRIAKVIGIIGLFGLLLVVCGIKYIDHYYPLASSAGFESFAAERENTNLLLCVHADIINSLKQNKFSFEEIQCASTNDPRFKEVLRRVPDITRVRAFNLRRGTLSGWMVCWVEKRVILQRVNMEFNVTYSMTEFDHRAFQRIFGGLGQKFSQRDQVVGANAHECKDTEEFRSEVITDKFNNAWVMSSGWAGYMGVAVALTSNKYYYWFYSDAGSDNEPSYPISSNYQYDGKTLILDSKEHLYSTAWVVVTNGGRLCLSAPSQTGDVARLLIPDPSFNSAEPFGNQRALKPQKP